MAMREPIPGRYRAPSVRSNRGRVSGYNSRRASQALDPVTEALRSSQAAAADASAMFRTAQAMKAQQPAVIPPPAPAPMDVPPPPPAPAPAGLALDPAIRTDLADPLGGTMADQPYGREAFGRMAGPANLNPFSPEAILPPSLAIDAPIRAPDFTGLAEDPLPKSIVDVPRIAADAFRQATPQLNPLNPLPQLAQVGTDAAKLVTGAMFPKDTETEAQELERRARAKATPINADANATRAGASVTTAAAAATNAEANKKKTAADTTLIKERAKTEPVKRGEIARRELYRKAGLEQRNAALRLNQIQLQGKLSESIRPPGWFGGEDPQQAEAERLRQAAGGITLPVPPPPPAPADDATLEASGKAEVDQLLEEAREILAEPELHDEEDVRQARLLLQKAGEAE